MKKYIIYRELFDETTAKFYRRTLATNLNFEEAKQIVKGMYIKETKGRRVTDAMGWYMDDCICPLFNNGGLVGYCVHAYTVALVSKINYSSSKSKK